MANPVITRISPAAYWRLKDALQKAELDGYGPDDASAIAQTAIGLYPPCAREIVVDYALDGPIYPFMAWPEDLARTATEGSKNGGNGNG